MNCKAEARDPNRADFIHENIGRVEIAMDQPALV
jgi:hypothetical protein